MANKRNFTDILILLAALNTIAMGIVMGFLMISGLLTKNKLKQMLMILRDEGVIISMKDKKVLDEAKEIKKKWQERLKKEAEIAGEDVVNKAYAYQNKILEEKKKILKEEEERLAKLRSQIEEEKERIERIKKEIENTIKKFKKERELARKKAESEGIKKAVKIFKNMDPNDIAQILKGDINNPKDIREAATYIKLMNERQAAEVLSAMGSEWAKKIKEELKKEW